MISLQFDSEIIALRTPEEPVTRLVTGQIVRRRMDGQLRTNVKRGCKTVHDVQCLLLGKEKLDEAEAFFTAGKARVLHLTFDLGTPVRVKLVNDPVFEETRPFQYQASLSFEELP